MPVLSEHGRRVVPDRMLAGSFPSPVASLRDQNEHRHTERAGEVRNRGVDRNDRVEPHDQLCRRPPVLGKRRQIADEAIEAERGDFLGSVTDLQRIERHVWDFEQRRQSAQRH